MKSEDFEKKMNELKPPMTQQIKPPTEIKLAILNAQRSATIGLWLIAVPFLLLSIMVLKYELQINLGMLDFFAESIQAIDKNPATWWLQPVFIFALPTLAIVLNILSITHFRWDPDTSLMTLSIKVKWFNVIVLLTSGFILLVFLLYLMGENL